MYNVVLRGGRCARDPLCKAKPMKIEWLAKLQARESAPAEPSRSLPAEPAKSAKRQAAASVGSSPKRWKAGLSRKSYPRAPIAHVTGHVGVKHEPLIRPSEIRHINPTKIVQSELFKQIASDAVSDLDLDVLRTPHKHTYCTLCSGSEASPCVRVCACVRVSVLV